MTFKLADFSQARILPPHCQHSRIPNGQLWYTAPELLLGVENADLSCDIWSFACIVAYMATGRPLFGGDSKIDTLFKVFQILGTPTEANCPDIASFSLFSKRYPQWRGKGFAHLEAYGPA